jgi:hypothetical protein
MPSIALKSSSGIRVYKELPLLYFHFSFFGAGFGFFHSVREVGTSPFLVLVELSGSHVKVTRPKGEIKG